MKKQKAKPEKKKQPKVAIPKVEVKPEPIVAPKQVLTEADLKRREVIRDKMVLMKYKDLQINCVVRGIDFDFMVAKDINGLQTWLINNWEMPCIQDRLAEFDKYREGKLKESGREGEPFVRLGYIGPIDEETGEVISIKKPEKMITQPRKRERDTDTGIFLGTKKAYTLELAKKGEDIPTTIKLVMEKFPEAKEKSIKIWYKRFKKATKK